MELKKNNRVIHHKRLGTVMSDMGTYDVVNKESWIDVLLDDEEHICQIRKDFLKKIEDEKILAENKLHNLPIQLNTRKDIDSKCYEIMKEKTLYICLEELAELQQAITKFLRGKPNMENIEEEIADVEICLEWVKDIIKPNENHIEAWKDYKYNRMKSRIEKGEMK